MADERIVSMPIDQIQSNPLQPRGVVTPESLVDLVDSIREHGILEPLIIAKTPAGYQLIAGERRWRASKIVGLKDVPVVIRETTPKGMLEMAIVENVQRVDLNVVERAKAFQRLVDEFMLSTAEIAKRIGKSQAYVSNSLKILTLPDAIKDGILSYAITEGHARALAGIESPKLMIEAYKMVLRESASVRRAEDIARRMKEKENTLPTGIDSAFIVSESIDKLREDLENALIAVDNKKKSTAVKLFRSRIETKIIIKFKGSLEQTEEKLQKVYKAICN